MSGRNLEIVLESMRTFVAGDFGRVELWHPDCRITAPEGWPEQGPFVGRDAVMAQFERLGADFGEQTLDVTTTSARDDWVVVEFEWSTRGSSSGAETQLEMAAAFRVQEGQLIEGHYRWSRAAALEAAGLPAKET